MLPPWIVILPVNSNRRNYRSTRHSVIAKAITHLERNDPWGNWGWLLFLIICGPIYHSRSRKKHSTMFRVSTCASKVYITCKCPEAVFALQNFSSYPHFRVYLGVRTCELFLCFAPFVFLCSIVLTSLFPLFYITCEFNRFLHRGATFSLEILNATFTLGGCLLLWKVSQKKP